MPTFDFNNIVKKLIAAGVAVTCSPVLSILAVSSLVAGIVTGFTTFFDEVIQVPDFQVERFGDIFNGHITSILLYAVNFDLCITFIKTFVSILVSVLKFSIVMGISSLTLFVTYGTYKIVRKTVNQFK